MATAPNPLMDMMSQRLGGGQPQGPPQPSPLAPTGDADAESTYYAIDPAVLDRPVRIRIEGSRRMLARPALQNAFQALAPTLLSGPVVQALAMNGQKVDIDEMLQLLQDATGIASSYKLIVPLSPQEQQARQTPPPQVNAQIQLAQQDAQTRLQIMDKKGEIEKMKVDSAERLKTLQIQEESARAILATLAKEKADILKNAPDPSAAQNAQLKMMMDAQGAQQDMRAQAQTHQLGLTHQSQAHQLDLAQQLQRHQLDMTTAAQSGQQDRLANAAKTRSDLDRAQALLGQKIQDHEVNRKIKLENTRSQGSSVGGRAKKP